MVTRQQLAQMLTEPQVRYAHPFACRNTYGFGADFLGLLKTLTACLNLRLGFYLCPPKRPQGYVIKYGWNDYFDPLFEMIDAPLMHYLNIPRLPLQPQFPALRPLASAWLRATSRPKARYFWFDDIGDRDTYQVPPGFQGCEHWGQARAKLMQLMWQYNQETSDQVAAIRSEIHLPDVYHSVCIRRGDKNTEHAYVPIETYVRTIESTCAPGIPLFATSDDYQCIVDLARAMPDRMFVSLTKPSADGYYHADFKQLHPQERRNRTARFFAQLECLWGAESFIGSRTTNVGLMVNAYRGGDNVIWVD